MNTPIWKHIKLTNKSCIGTLLAVLISMFVNMDMYGQLYYINGILVEDYDNRYMRLSYCL